MNKLTRMALDRTLEVNQRLSRGAANSVDWIFKRDTLIKSGRTWFELVHDGDLMAVRYYWSMAATCPSSASSTLFRWS
jgi:polyhydroxyalkanoate synthase